MKHARPYNMEFNFLEPDEKFELFMQLVQFCETPFEFYFEFNGTGYLRAADRHIGTKSGMQVTAVVRFEEDGMLAKRALVSDYKIWEIKNKEYERIRRGDVVTFSKMLVPRF